MGNRHVLPFPGWPMDLSQDLARQLLDAAPDPTVVVAADGRIVFANAQVAAVFGHAPDDLAGRDVECLLPERFRGAHAGHRQRYFGQLETRPMGAGLDLRGLHRDGREFPVEISLSPIETPDGALVISAIRDVSRQREAERQLAEANRAKSRFLAAASHDLRQPLQALSLLAGAAARRAGDNEAIRQIVEKQRQALDSMSGLLNSLLDISKLDAGLVVPKPVDFELEDLFAWLRSDFSEQAQAKGIELVIGRSADSAHTDPDLLGQLLMNLVSNALRYTVEGRVVVSSRRRGARIDCEVADTGLGIAEGELGRIFDEFYQVDNGVRRPEGLGLGLSIVRRLCTLLGLELDVKSVPGRGTSFTLSIPAGHAPAVRPPASASMALPAGLRALIVDDEAVVADATRLLLEVEGFEVDVAGSEAEARASIDRRVPDVIISDYHLRAGETGVAVVAAVNAALGRRLPVVFVTGDTRRGAPADLPPQSEFLTKPLRSEALLDAIRRVVGAAVDA